ncbi:MAG: shikimate dehydrogenase [Duodenibacillus sp.]|nr:shikimate dehydrogenase [Duodenibacillus sp.]
MSRFFVIGNPVEHSLSPEIHAMFAASAGIEDGFSYEKARFETGRFVEGVSALVRERAPKGCNITLPFKQDAYDYCINRRAEITGRARAARAVNTLFWAPEGLRADNTDGIGLVQDLEKRWSVSLRGARVLILGAGGAARGLLAVLKDEGCASIHLANRTPAKAVDLARDFGVRSVLFTETWAGGYDVVINTTSASLSNEAPAIPNSAFKDASVAYDLFYSIVDTPFMRLARDSGVKLVLDGLGMLVEQAAESFYFWNGVRVATEPVYQALSRKIHEIPE